jgi:hypothetical protein
MRNGEGKLEADMAEEIISKRADASKIKSSRIGMVFFIPVTDFFCFRFLFKRVLVKIS